MQRTPHHRGLRLDGPIEDLHRAVDRLRGDTVPAARPLATRTAPTRRRRQGFVHGQAVLPEEASCTSTCT
jgi:hypothetical protein